MKDLVVLDCEVYPNYTLFAFKNIDNQKTFTIEIKGESSSLDQKSLKKLQQIMTVVTTFGFNSRNYDMPIILFALQGKTAKEICELSNYIIKNNSPTWKTLQNFGLSWSNSIKHFDIQEPSPGGKISLKLYGGRMHSDKLQDLPIEPNSILSGNEMEETKLYCINDLNTTIDLYKQIEDRIKLRVDMSKQYGQDLLSKSDAQIAEVVIKTELNKKKIYCKTPTIPNGKTFRYEVPDFIKFKSKQLKDILEIIKTHHFELDGKGSIKLPSVLKNAKIEFTKSIYQLGIGGLHSSEKAQCIIPTEHQLLIDKDVVSYYPSIILNQKLYPRHLGTPFLDVYEQIVKERLRAKKEGNKIVNESLKIVINGSFGKLGSKYSVLYSPDLMIAVTLTGQLCLLMLIEELENNDISVISANTDGFVSLLTKDQYNIYSSICFNWESDTGFTLEENRYDALYSRDVNNYLAIYDEKYYSFCDMGYKGKGIFTLDSLKKNPQATIIINAVIKLLIDNIPISETIRNCKDVKEFLHVRSVVGGAIYKDKYLGRVVRWIYSTNGGIITYKEKKVLDTPKIKKYLKSKYNLELPAIQIKELEFKYDNVGLESVEVEGNKILIKDILFYRIKQDKVAKSEGSRPIMDLNCKFPRDIDYDRYIEESMSILDDLGVTDL